ncbi:hypothetical protein LSAT2_033135 [Lamellibrachia satsuma]|nr:hypothetical protein LSAT2_033135 [Lamellibrachia satsuma]
MDLQTQTICRVTASADHRYNVANSYVLTPMVMCRASLTVRVFRRRLSGGLTAWSFTERSQIEVGDIRWIPAQRGFRIRKPTTQHRTVTLRVMRVERVVQQKTRERLLRKRLTRM